VDLWTTQGVAHRVHRTRNRSKHDLPSRKKKCPPCPQTPVHHVPGPNTKGRHEGCASSRIMTDCCNP
jgi:hypothetical protein